MAKLHELIKAIENNKKIGMFSKSSKTIGDGHTFDIPFAQKPSQQLLAALGGHKDFRPGLLTKKNKINTSANTDVRISSFAPSVKKSELIISGARIDRLFNSAHIYINTDLLPQKPSSKPVQSKSLGAANIATMNKSVAQCHAQEIDLLVDTYVSSTGRAHTTVYPDKTSIQVDSPALLLLTTPSLDHSQKDLDTREKQIQFISAMYRTLFHAARTEGRMHIVMSTEGLGKQGRLHALYFDVLMSVAKEYPDLNIIYNAGTHEKEFDKFLKTAKNPDNVGRITKNIIFVAQELIRQGKLCAIHNPASIDVLYGLADVGEHWQSIAPSCFGTDNPGNTMQSFLGTVSTAVLGSYGINPEAFNRIIERNLNPAMAHLEAETSTVPTSTLTTEIRSNTTVIEGKQGIQAIDQEQNNASRNIELEVAASATLESSIVALPKALAPVLLEATVTEKPCSSGADPVIQEVPNNTSIKETKGEKHFEDQAPRPLLSIDTSLSLFPPSPPKASTAQSAQEKSKEEEQSSLNEKQLEAINKTIDRLVGEIQSCWPYPNKNLKKIKVNALNTLILKSRTMDIPNAIVAVMSEYPRALEGHFSTRTADLFHNLEKESRILQAS